MSSTYWLFGAHLTVLADEQLTRGTYDLIEGRFSAGTETPLHLHTRYDESIYVLEGEFEVYTDRETAVLKPGQHIFVPRNTPHAVVASGRSVNRALTVASPGGFGQLIRTVGIPAPADGTPPEQPTDMGLFVQLSAETGDVILGGPGARPTLRA